MNRGGIVPRSQTGISYLDLNAPGLLVENTLIPRTLVPAFTAQGVPTPLYTSPQTPLMLVILTALGVT